MTAQDQEIHDQGLISVLKQIHDNLDAAIRTLHKWVRRTSSPSGTAKTLLKIAVTHPQSIREALRAN